jgi:lactate dehydrogenase-like 2-hydroxyacid dehydrogenase
MDGIWAEWLSHFESVSNKIEAIAARTDEELAGRIIDADVVFGRLPRASFLLAGQLKWVQRIGLGFETMLYDEMVDSDVVRTNTVGAFDAAMAEHALALILSWTGGIITAERNRHDRVYTRKIPVSQIDGRRVCTESQNHRTKRLDPTPSHWGARDSRRRTGFGTSRRRGRACGTGRDAHGPRESRLCSGSPSAH